MKKHIILFLLLTISAGMMGQGISFNYDADGNLEARNIIPFSVQLIAGKVENTAPIVSDFLDRKITIHPNPTKGRLRIDIAPIEEKEKNFIQLYDMNGKLLKSLPVVSERTELEITGNPGVYLLDIHLGKEVSKWKIIKQ